MPRNRGVWPLSARNFSAAKESSLTFWKVALTDSYLALSPVSPKAPAQGVQRLAIAGVVSRLHDRLAIGRQRRGGQRQVGPLDVRVQRRVGVVRIGHHHVVALLPPWAISDNWNFHTSSLPARLIASLTGGLPLADDDRGLHAQGGERGFVRLHEDRGRDDAALGTIQRRLLVGLDDKHAGAFFQ